MAPPGVELLVAARRDAVVPALVVGLGGVWTELLDDAAVVPLPASPARVEAALRSLRAARGPHRRARRARRRRRARPPAGRGRRRPAAPSGLELLELNPVLVHERGVAVDALAAKGRMKVA